MKITFLTENKTQKEGVFAEHGLSIYIETMGKKILFDSGASSLVIRNANMIGVDLTKIDFAVASHGHYDHTGGFPAFHELNPQAPIYFQKEAFHRAYSSNDGKPIMSRETGIRWDNEEKRELDKVIKLTGSPVYINNDIVISGKIPDIPSMLRFGTYFIETDEGLVVDPMDHEQFLAIREGNGIFVFSGCSHKGTGPIIEYCRQLFPREKIKLFVSGMHLFHSGPEIREKVINDVVENIDGDIMPVHCTGIVAMCELKQAMGDRCIIPTAGESYEY